MTEFRCKKCNSKVGFHAKNIRKECGHCGDKL